MRMRLVDDIDSDEARPGDARFYSYRERARAGMLIRCPGCASLVRLPLAPARNGGAAWEWDGNVEAPTLSPSIRHVDPACGWHGWLRSGEFVGL